MKNDMNIRVLDCTLRDGGHIVEGDFGEKVIKYIIKKLVDAKVDIIEVGFLWDKYCGKDSARYLSIEDVKRVLPEDCGMSQICLMADFIDLDNLEEYDGTVEYIRLSFKRSRQEWAWNTLRVLKEKGYKCFINPVNCNVYSDEEYLEIIRKVNELRPYGFSIVDTFGVMRVQDLSSRYYLVENNLNKDICIGVHLHENLGLAYSLAQHFINIHLAKRKIVIDGSLLGMGRVPGNLCIEQIMDYLNVCYGSRYVLSSAYDAIDDCIAPIKNKIQWGYMIPFALSAQKGLHRTYAEFLLNKWKLKTSDIESILDKVERSEAELFNEKYINDLYKDYLSVEVDDICDRERIKKNLREKDILLVAPGNSISRQKDDIVLLKKRGLIVVSINFVPDFVDPDYVFYTNIKRIELAGRDDEIKYESIMTSNLLHYDVHYNYMLNYLDLSTHNGIYCEDSTLMFIKLLHSMDIRTIWLAGFDGFLKDANNLYNGVLERDEKGKYKNEEVKKILDSVYNDMVLKFVTKSIYRGDDLYETGCNQIIG